MSLLEKYLEDKNEMLVKVEEIHKKCDEAIDTVGGEFLKKFKTMIANASDEEFHEFMCNSCDELDEVERMAALTARLESYGKRCREGEDKQKDEPNKVKGHRVVVVEL